MSDKKTVKIFIASSGELKEEREKCIALLAQLNKSHKHLHLEPIEWEMDMTSGNVPGYATIQKAINPKLAESDFAVFIFYSRLGTYTKEEFELATAKEKKLFAYFKKGFSPEEETEFEAYKALKDFKKSLNATVLYKDYKDCAEFEKLLFPDLNLYLIDNYPPASTVTEGAVSQSVATLIQLLAAKEEKIKQLEEANRALPPFSNDEQLEQFIKEKEGLQEQLQQSKEIQEQQAIDKAILEQQLSLQIEHDELKKKALKEVENKNYKAAENYLKESAKQSIEDTAATFYELAKIKKLQLQYKEAFNYYELAVKIAPENSLYLYDTGLIADTLGFYDLAFDYYEKSLQVDKERLGEEHVDIATEYNQLGIMCNNKGEYNKAIEYYEKALIIYKKNFGDSHEFIAVNYNNLGSAYDSKGDYDKAIDYYLQALTMDKKYYGEEHPEIAIRYNNLGEAYRNKGEYDKAIDYYLQAHTIDKKYFGEEHPNIAIRYNNLGLVYKSKCEYDKAISFYTNSLAIFNKYLPHTHPYIQKVQQNLQIAKDAQQ